MIRRLFVPALAATLLAGCVTGYQYRAGPGDYYYGQPEVEYRGSVYYSHGYPYGYGYYGYGHPYGHGYGYPYGYYAPYWGPWWGWHRRPGHDGHDHDHDDGDRPPWRNIGILPDRDGDQPRLRTPGPGGAPIHPTLPPRRAIQDDPPRAPRPSLPPSRAGIEAPRPLGPTLPARQAGEGLRPMTPSLPARRAVDAPRPARPALPARRDADPPRRASPPPADGNRPERELRRRNQP